MKMDMLAMLKAAAKEEKGEKHMKPAKGEKKMPPKKGKGGKSKSKC
jgi:hypothetical protein